MLLAVALGAAAGGFVQGLNGLGFGLIAMPVWVWAMPPTLAGPMVVFGSLLGQVRSLGTIRHGFDARRLTPFLVGGVLGVPVGVMPLGRIDPLGFKFGVDLLLVLWCPTMLLARDLPCIRRGGRLPMLSPDGWMA